jgi:hypothetical protein
VQKTAGQSYTGRESLTLQQLDFHQNKNLIFETRASISASFPEDNEYTIKIARVTSDFQKKYTEGLFCS